MPQAPVQQRVLTKPRERAPRRLAACAAGLLALRRRVARRTAAGSRRPHRRLFRPGEQSARVMRPGTSPPTDAVEQLVAARQRPSSHECARGVPGRTRAQRWLPWTGSRPSTSVPRLTPGRDEMSSAARLSQLVRTLTGPERSEWSSSLVDGAKVPRRVPSRSQPGAGSVPLPPDAERCRADDATPTQARPPNDHMMDVSSG